MKRVIKSALSFLVFILGINLSITAQDVTQVQAKDETIAENLNLEAVASIFGEAKDLEDFEYQLNNPDNQISNLDLNGDNNVDYLRVIELTENATHVITIQAVIGENQYQDVATIEVEKDSQGTTTVQVVGDVYMYGPDYIIEPVYIHPPVFFYLFWRPYYRPYRSVYYWGYYPHHFHYWHPVHVNVYRTNVHVHINSHFTYRRTSVRRSHIAVSLHRTHRRNDLGRSIATRSRRSGTSASAVRRSRVTRNSNIRNTAKAPKTAKRNSVKRQKRHSGNAAHRSHGNRNFSKKKSKGNAKSHRKPKRAMRR